MQSISSRNKYYHLRKLQVIATANKFNSGQNFFKILDELINVAL